MWYMFFYIHYKVFILEIYDERGCIPFDSDLILVLLALV